METQYAGLTGTVYRIPSEKLAGGGEGDVYEIMGDPSQVMKIFKPERRTREREEKIRQMVQYRLSEQELSQIAWPQDVVYDLSGFAGYVMPRLTHNKNLNHVYSSGGNGLHLRHRMLIAYNVCAAVDTVHSLQQVCGDLNPQNICVNFNLMDANALRVTLVDTDSYHITVNETTYRCEVGLADYIAPEIQKKLTGGMNLKNAPLPTYTKETDLFALAVHVFALLMNGSHPFACAQETNGTYRNNREAMNSENQESVVLPQPIDNIKDGYFPFHQKREGVTHPLYAPDFDSLPETLRKLFVRTFENGYDDPKARVTAAEWMEGIKRVSMQDGFMECDMGHWHFSHSLGNCPICGIRERMNRFVGRSGPIPNLPSSQDGSNSSGNQEKGFWQTHFRTFASIFAATLICSVILVGSVALDEFIKSKSEPSMESNLEEQTDPSQGISTEEQYEDQMSMGDQYVNEGLYDLAKVAYDYARCLISNRPRAYTALANVMVEQGDYNGAIDLLNQGLSECESSIYWDEYNEMEDYLEKVQVEQDQFDAGIQLMSEMVSKNYKKVAKLAWKHWLDADLGETIYIQDGKLVETIDDGYGLRYDVVGNYVFLGDIKNGKANGKGLEVGGLLEGYYTLKGKFLKGFANGKCTLFYSKLKSSSGKKYSSTVTGKFKNGYENGTMERTNRYLSSGKKENYTYHAKMGTYTVLRVENGKYVYGENKDYYWYCNNKKDLSGHGAPNQK